MDGNFSSMNILVTGATGFVGTSLCYLLKEKHSVSVVIRNPDDTKKLPTGIKSIFVESIEQSFPLQSLNNAEVIIYLAARVHQMKNHKPDALEAYRTINTYAPIHLAKQAVKNGVKRFIYLSSVKVNGEEAANLPHSYSEEDPANPVDFYGQSKWEAEQGLFQLAEETGLEVVVIRPPLIYGARVKANFLQLLKIIDKSIPLPFSSIQNSRSLVYVGNLVDAIIACIEHPNAKNQTFIVSDNEDLSTPELIRRLGNALGKPPILLPVPTGLIQFAGKITGKTNVVNRLLGSLQVDSSKIRQMLNWKPPYTVDEGMQATVDWLKQQ